MARLSLSHGWDKGMMRSRHRAESVRAQAIQPRSGLPADSRVRIIPPLVTRGRVAQLVEQGIENPRVGG
ncbi:MAG: hypothetical protein ACMG5Z_02450, partial [Luteimonas sp.]